MVPMVQKKTIVFFVFPLVLSKPPKKIPKVKDTPLERSLRKCAWKPLNNPVHQKTSSANPRSTSEKNEKHSCFFLKLYRVTFLVYSSMFSKTNLARLTIFRLFLLEDPKLTGGDFKSRVVDVWDLPRVENH